MYLTKNPYDPITHKSLGVIVETVIISSSFRADFDVFLKSFTQNTLREYEKMLEEAYPEVVARARAKAHYLGAEGIFNVSVGFETMYPGVVLIHFSGDAVGSL
ncbi:MAG: heavy metal-binding domain-containing protein [Bacillota bacterium]|nr:heavy metal-binding domain-containing protein [Bacillota bacterium]